MTGLRHRFANEFVKSESQYNPHVTFDPFTQYIYKITIPWSHQTALNSWNTYVIALYFSVKRHIYHVQLNSVQFH